jgi:hypothetical protein
MDPNAATELIEASGAAAAVARLVYLKLAQRFRALFAYLVFLAAMEIGIGSLSQASKYYFWGYVALEPLECMFGIMAVRELLALTFNDYPGIRTVGRWVMYAGMALAVGISLFLAGFFWNNSASGRAHSHVYYFELSKRSIVFSLAFVIVTILIFLSKYPLHLSRNTLVSSAFFSILFLSEASRLLVDSLAPQLHNQYVDWTENIFTSLCLFGWAALLKPESQQLPVRIRFPSPREDHLLDQLNALNRLMTRAAKK